MRKLLRTPKQVDLLITSRCNLRCKYCSYYTSAGDTGKELSTQEWLKCFEELNRLTVLEVVIQGGEPFCRKDLKELIKGIVHNRMRFRILTNGTLISDDMAAFLVSTGRCNSVQVSIDGSSPITHDSMRGEGNFAKAIKGLKVLQKHGVPVQVRVTINKQNVRDLQAIAKLLLEDFKLSSFSTNSAGYMGLCRSNTGMVQLTAEERSLAIETLLKLNKKYNNRILANSGPLAEGKNWLRMERWRREKRSSAPYRGRLTACGVSFSSITIRADGIIVPCAQISHIELGRINKDDIMEIWHNHPELKRLRSRHDIPLSNFEFCKKCEYVNYCTGGCPATAYTVFGEVNRPASEGCLKRFLEAGGRLPDEKELIPLK